MKKQTNPFSSEVTGEARVMADLPGCPEHYKQAGVRVLSNKWYKLEFSDLKTIHVNAAGQVVKRVR